MPTQYEAAQWTPAQGRGDIVGVVIVGLKLGDKNIYRTIVRINQPQRVNSALSGPFSP